MPTHHSYLDAYFQCDSWLRSGAMTHGSCITGGTSGSVLPMPVARVCMPVRRGLLISPAIDSGHPERHLVQVIPRLVGNRIDGRFRSIGSARFHVGRWQRLVYMPCVQTMRCFGVRLLSRVPLLPRRRQEFFRNNNILVSIARPGERDHGSRKCCVHETGVLAGPPPPVLWCYCSVPVQ